MGTTIRIRRSCLPYRKARILPRSIRQQDSDDESPRCKARQVRSPRKLDVPAVPVSSTAASSRDIRSLLYDGRLTYYPVSIRMPDLVVDNVVTSGGLPNVITPPGDYSIFIPGRFGREDGVLRAGPGIDRGF